VQNGGMSTERPIATNFLNRTRAVCTSVSTHPVLAQQFGDAYRDGDMQLAEKLHRELFKQHFYKVQLFCERRILRMQTALAIFEAEDIAIEAWEAVIQLIQRRQLEVHSDIHFIRLLFKTAKHRFLDRLRRSAHRVSTVALERPSSDGSYIVEQDAQLGNATSDRPAWLSDNPTLHLLQCLFASDISFTNACAVRPRRRAKVYQAAILYLLITETMAIETDIPPFVPYILAACGLQQSHWDAFLSAMGRCEYPSPDTILTAVNIVFDTNINTRKSISVLKYEFTQMIPHTGRRLVPGSTYAARQKAGPLGPRRTRNATDQPQPFTPGSSPESPVQAAPRAPHQLARGRHPQPTLRGNA
jgi:DNA-directed RNA polymerase specialized sigma24 family protein